MVRYIYTYTDTQSADCYKLGSDLHMWGPQGTWHVHTQVHAQFKIMKAKKTKLQRCKRSPEVAASVGVQRNRISPANFSCSLKMVTLCIRASINIQNKTKHQTKSKDKQLLKTGVGWGDAFSIVGYFWGLGRMHTCLLHPWLRRSCTSQPPQLWALISSSPGIQSQVLLVGCSPGCYPLVSALPKVSFRPALLCGSLKVFIFCLEEDRGRFDFSLGKRRPCV